MTEQYTYEYDHNKSIEENASNSMAMDKVRSTMGPTATEVKERAAKARAELNGHFSSKPPEPDLPAEPTYRY